MATKISTKQKITPCLWFDNNIVEAVKFYTSVFKKSKILVTTHYGKNAPMPEGTPMTITLPVERTGIYGIERWACASNSPTAISFMVNCDTQKEIDYYWEKLFGGWQ